jgi:hypothetical protein
MLACVAARFSGAETQHEQQVTHRFGLAARVS